MDKASVHVDISGAVAKLKELDRGLREDVLTHAVGAAQLRWVNDNFKNEGTESRWAPLSPNTVAGRRGKGGAGSKRILQDTGRLRQSFVNEYRPGEVWTGSRMPTALWHHYGTSPYDIVPKAATVLRFGVATGGVKPTGKLVKGWAFASKVHHPGLQARPLVPSHGTAMRTAFGVLNAYFQKLVDKINATRSGQ